MGKVPLYFHSTDEKTEAKRKVSQLVNREAKMQTQTLSPESVLLSILQSWTESENGDGSVRVNPRIFMKVKMRMYKILSCLVHILKQYN